MNGGFNGNVNWLMSAGISLAFHAILVVVLLSCNSAQEKNPSLPSTERKVAEATGEPSKADTSAQDAQPETASPAKTPDPLAARLDLPVKAPEKVSVKAPEKTSGKVPEQNAEDAVEYVVQPGDTLSKIAKLHSCTLGELAKLNGKSVKALSALRVGQRIRVKGQSR